MEFICSGCKQPKDYSEFSKSQNKRGYSYACKACLSLRYKYKYRVNEWAKKYRTTDINKEYEKQFRKKYLKSFRGTAGKLLSIAKSRAKFKKLDFDLDIDWLIENMKPMICQKTGIPLTLQKYEQRKFRANPFNPSLDRIDNKKGYTKDNVQIVCWCYNIAKSDFDDETVLKMATALVSKNQFR